MHVGVVSPVLVLANFFEITLDVIMAQTVDSGVEEGADPCYRVERFCDILDVVADVA